MRESLPLEVELIGQLNGETHFLASESAAVANTLDKFKSEYNCKQGAWLDCSG